MDDLKPQLTPSPSVIHQRLRVAALLVLPLVTLVHASYVIGRIHGMEYVTGLLKEMRTARPQQAPSESLPPVILLPPKPESYCTRLRRKANERLAFCYDVVFSGLAFDGTYVTRRCGGDAPPCEELFGSLAAGNPLFPTASHFSLNYSHGNITLPASSPISRGAGSNNLRHTQGAENDH